VTVLGGSQVRNVNADRSRLSKAAKERPEDAPCVPSPAQFTNNTMSGMLMFSARSILLILSLAFVPWFGASVQAAAFNLDQVVTKARELAQRPYTRPPQVPEFMRTLSYDEFRSIRFDPQRSLWQGTGSRFEVMLMVPGLFFTHPVKINVIDSSGVTPLAFNKEYFQSDNTELFKKLPADLGYAGFKLTYPLNKPDVQDQFLAFAGASYFRATGKGDNFGLSARGAALDTGLMSGEEFPDFIEYWLERPAAGAKTMKFYALLDSKRLTGAYKFTVQPGQPTQLDVEAVLFTRDRVELLGVAPLTSMFYYGENTARPRGQWRPEVHDSDGLLLHNGTGEWLWNPLMNPRALHIQAFSVADVKGFGLMQRDQRFAAYQDPEAAYDRRPSAWITPKGSWGPGRVMLVEIPTPDETNDNIVAFWSPPTAVEAGKEMRFDYRIEFGDAQATDAAPEGGIGRAVDTFVGRGDVMGGGNAPGAYRIIVDFKGGELDKLAPGAPIGTDVTAQEGGKVLEHFLVYVEPSKVWRLSILARPAANKPLAVRARLKMEQESLTETWTYTLPQDNDISGPPK
jgi:periplasmic glucans biosynthesis protein